MIKEPVCYMGYTEPEVRSLVGARWEQWLKWSIGNTGGVCEEHGFVTYFWDVEAFLKGHPNLD